MYFFIKKRLTARSCVGANVVNSDYDEIDIEENYKEGISWDRKFFVGSGIKISLSFGIRDQNFGLKNGISHEKIYLVTTLKLPCKINWFHKQDTIFHSRFWNADKCFVSFQLFCWLGSQRPRSIFHSVMNILYTCRCQSLRFVHALFKANKCIMNCLRCPPRP